jgi:KDO2-lipid IV(A) lauroyltransferase
MSRVIYGWLTAVMASLPLRVGYALADLATELHFRLFPGRRHAALANLAVVLPGAGRRDRMRIVRGMMRSYNRMMFEFFRLPHLGRDELLRAVEVEGRQHLEHAIARGRGVIVTCCHVGNWELGAVVVAHWGYAVHAVAGVQITRWLTGAVRETKEELAIHTVSPEDGFRKLLRALEQNHIVALMVDGDIYNHGVTVEMFGRDTSFPSGPGVLAQNTGALVLNAYCARTTPGRFQIVIEPPLDPATFASAADLNRKIASVTERHVREHLDQWCIFRPLWEDAPATAAERAAAARRIEA